MATFGQHGNQRAADGIHDRPDYEPGDRQGEEEAVCNPRLEARSDERVQHESCHERQDVQAGDEDRIPREAAHGRVATAGTRIIKRASTPGTSARSTVRTANPTRVTDAGAKPARSFPARESHRAPTCHDRGATRPTRAAARATSHRSVRRSPSWAARSTQAGRSGPVIAEV